MRVLDSLLFGNHLPAVARESHRLELIHGDIRDRELVRTALQDVDAVVHLAALANDPSAELDTHLTRAVNRDGTLFLLDDAVAAGVRRFVNASSATVYGVRDEPDVVESLDHRPITLYGKYKSETDLATSDMASDSFATVNIRSATVCGLSAAMYRMRSSCLVWSCVS